MSSMIQVNRIYLIFNSVHFLVDSSDLQSLDSSSVDKANGDIIRMMDDGNIK